MGSPHIGVKYDVVASLNNRASSGRETDAKAIRHAEEWMIPETVKRPRGGSAVLEVLVARRIPEEKRQKSSLDAAQYDIHALSKTVEGRS